MLSWKKKRGWVNRSPLHTLRRRRQVPRRLTSPPSSKTIRQHSINRSIHRTAFQILSPFLTDFTTFPYLYAKTSLLWTLPARLTLDSATCHHSCTHHLTSKSRQTRIHTYFLKKQVQDKKAKIAERPSDRAEDAQSLLVGADPSQTLVGLGKSGKVTFTQEYLMTTME